MTTETGTKSCTGCGETKPLAAFGPAASSPDGHQWRCRDCRNVYFREYGQRNRERVLAYKREWRQANKEKVRTYTKPEGIEARRERNRRWVWEYKLANPCVGTLDGPCPYSATDPRVLEFDHIGDDKEADVTRMVSAPFALARVQAEVAKCVVRCRNCHAVVTQERAGSYVHRFHSAG